MIKKPEGSINHTHLAQIILCLPSLVSNGDLPFGNHDP